jgi:hypothetical protein
MSRSQLLFFLLGVSICQSNASPNDNQELAALEKKRQTILTFQKNLDAVQAKVTHDLTGDAIMHSAYKPNIGEPDLDKALSLMHESYMALNAGDALKSMKYSTEARVFFEQWEVRENSQLSKLQ